MVRKVCVVLLCAFFFSIVALASEDRALTVKKKSVANERRVALIIGNNAYHDAPLKNAANDADAMSRVLRDTGFDIILIKNADRRNMFSAIKEFSRKLKKSDLGLFYYAGHGVQVENSNYLLPVDVKGNDLQDADDLRYTAVPLNEIMDQMRDASTNNIIILDACRDNPFLAKLSRSTSRGLAKVTTPASTSILYSTDPGNTASDGVRGDNGVFTNRLIESIQKTGLELVEVMREVSTNVSQDTNGVQHPVFDGVLSSKFYFRAPVAVVTQVQAEPSIQNISVDSKVFELRYWESAEKSGSALAYQSYLNKFPKGEFADFARERQEQIKQQTLKASIEATAEQSRISKERAELDRRLRDIEVKAHQAEERLKQNEERLVAEQAHLATQKNERVKLAVPAQVKASLSNTSHADSETPKVNTIGFTTTELTVKDNKTDLIWGRKGNLSGNVYFRNVGAFIDKLNRVNYGGYSDWRLPAVNELETLAKYAKDEGWGDKEGHYVSDFLVNQGFIEVVPEYYITNNVEYNSFTAYRMWSGYTADNLPFSNKKDIYILPVRGVQK